MKKVTGVTEPYWSSLSEDQRLYWKYSSRAIAVLLSFFITKTGNAYFDWTVMALTAAFLVIIIETQRSYSRLSPRLRKWSIRAAIAVGSSALALAGLALFLQAAISGIFSVYAQHVAVDIQYARHPYAKYVIFSIFLAAAPVAVIRVARQLQIEELIYHLPRRSLKTLLIAKPYRTTTLAQFARMELSLLIACCLYASTVAAIANIFSAAFASLA